MYFASEDREVLDRLYKAILSLKDTEELHLFFEDLCSRNELCSMIHRWQILELIDEGKSYEEIIRSLAPEPPGSSDSPGSAETSGEDENGKESVSRKGKSRSATKVSSTTISRVKACYNNENGGYRTALRRLKGEG